VQSFVVLPCPAQIVSTAAPPFVLSDVVLSLDFRSGIKF
jgi:hypothetical protein